ncbi:immunity 22 family protein [Pedosphaera parvula]|uniref:Immunity protein 22 n=1 Tax=Pedosphaera parvula (strain Ellin514) TaxID=320771 RepID=B9XN07_PEDPL|nr:immunity 22 family protein [Pedosphaera parvula]EEF58803.1 hypothetical protein Cflav_PD1976 [Pedosphaera parvula Ellin514]
MLNYKSFQKGGKVSVWIGDFATYDDFDSYLSIGGQFELDFGFLLDELNLPESTVEESSESIQNLVNGFSWSDSYTESVIQAASRIGINKATTMVVFHNFEFDSSKVRVDPKALLVFLGTFSFS